MTTRRWQGDAVPIAQVLTLAPPASSGEVGIAINGKVLTYASWNAQAIADKWNLATTILDDVAQSPEFQEVVASIDGFGNLILTARTPGVPFTVATTVGGSPLSNEVQVLTRIHTASGGTFKITFSGQQTGTIAWNASAGTVQTALIALSNLASGDVVVTGGTGGPWTVTFGAAYAGQDVPLMTIDAASLTGGDTGQNELQRLSLTGATTPSTFKLRRSDTLVETAELTTPVSAADIDTEMTGLGYSTTSTGGDMDTGGTVVDGTITNDGRWTSAGYYDDSANFVTIGAVGGNVNHGLARFTLAVAQGTTLTQALLQMSAFSAGSVAVTGTVRANAADNATWPADQSAASGASLTTASDSFTMAGSASVWTIDVTSVIQEIVNRAGWVSGNAIVLQLRADPTNTSVHSFNSIEEGSPATLAVTATSMGNTPITIEWDGGNAKSNIAPLEVISVSGTAPVVITVRDGFADTAPDVQVLTTIPGGAAIVVTETQASKGPNHWDDVLNWSGGVLPVASDTVSIDHSSIDILYGINQSGIALASLLIGAGYTGQIGLPEINDSGPEKYVEYRQQSLKIGAPIVKVGDGVGSGSSLIRLDIQGDTTVDVRLTGTSDDAGLSALQIVSSAGDDIAATVVKGSVGFGLRQGELATVTTLKVGYRDTPTGDATVILGPGATCAALDMAGGTVIAAHAPTAITMTDGELTIDDGNITSIAQQAGIIHYNGNDTITLAEISGMLDFRQDMRAKTVTTLKLYEGFEYHDPHGVVTWTNPTQFIQCSPADGTLDVARDVQMTLSLL